MAVAHKPELSIIVPVLDEAAELPLLFANLADQKGIGFELILCDGGSADETLSMVPGLALKATFAVHLVRAGRGRGRQMNAGAALAQGRTLLFLHADSRFSAPDDLSIALKAFDRRRAETVRPVAGRFALRFRQREGTPSLAYAYYEAKARLNRPDCIRGDQGLMLARASFTLPAVFDETLPFLEDVRFASLAAEQGEWFLLPVEITTSARRFEREGLLRRQLANAIIANAVAVGWTELFPALPGLYHCHAETGRLLLLPILDGIRGLIGRHDREWRRCFWRATGRHVAANAWQLFFWLDVRRAFSQGKGSGGVEPRLLARYERCCRPFFLSPPAAFLAALLSRILFYCLCAGLRPWSGIRETSRSA